MENPLTLAVVNDSKTYAERCAKHGRMKASQYRGYLRSLAAKQAHYEHVHFGVRHKAAAIEQATNELVEYMDMHMAEVRESSNA